MRYYTLDALRGIGAIAVLNFHMGLIWHIAPYAYVAVDMFFVLSGYVIAMVYEQRLKDGLSPNEFMTLRLKRLWPIYMVGIFLGTAVMLCKIVAGQELPPIWAIPFNAMMLPSPWASETFPVNVPAWSLLCEMAAYGAFAVFLPRLTTGVILWIIAISLVALSRFGGDLNVGGDWSDFNLGFVRLAMSFPAGVLLFRLGVRQVSRGWQAVTIPVFAILWLYRQHVPDALTLLLVSLGLVYLGVRHELPKLLHRPAKILGAISYPLYIIHFPLLSPFQLFCRHFGIVGPLPAISFTVVVSALAYWLSRLGNGYPRTKADELQQ